MINIYFGRENIDKEKFIFESIAGKTCVITPDQYTLEAEKRAFSIMKVKGLLDVEILGFSRLSDRIISETGNVDNVLIDKYGRHMLLAGIILEQKDRLEVYKGLEEKKSFIEMMNNTISEIKQNNIGWEELLNITEELEEDSILKKKLKDIGCIYSEYEKVIAGKYTDSEDYMDEIVKRIEKSQYVKERDIWVYGFDCFSPKNFNIIRELMINAKNVNIVITYDESGEDTSIFELTKNAIKQLEKTADELGVECNTQQIGGYEKEKKDSLKTVERELYKLPVTPDEKWDGITLVRSAGIYGEAETAATYILDLVREKNLRFKDIGVVCNNISDCGPIVKRVFDRYNIPIFLDSKRQIASCVPVVFILAIMEIVGTGYDSSKIFRMLKTGFTNMTQEEIEELENYCLKYRITGNRWKKSFEKGKKEYSDDELMKLNKSREYVVNMMSDFDLNFKGGSTVTDRIKALYSFLVNDCSMPEKIQIATERQIEQGFIEEAQNNSQVWNAAVNLMEQMVELIGDKKYSAEMTSNILKAGFEGVETGILPPVCDGIAVGTAQRSRFGEIKAMIVMEANEGVLPKGPAEGELLNDDELSFLEEKDINIGKIEKVKSQEEVLGIYRTFSTPSEYLWIGTACTDGAGDQQKPSPIINTIKRIFPTIKEDLDIISKGDPLPLVGTPTSTVDHMSVALQQGLEGRKVEEEWKQVISWYGENDPDTLQMIRKGLFFSVKQNNLEKEKVDKLYKKDGKELSLSPSRLETYCRCPFAHFITYGLRPRERKVFEMAGREIGDVYHHVLKKLSERLTDEGVGVTDEKSLWMTITYEEYKALISEIIEEEIAEYNEGLLSHTGEEEYRTARLSEIMEYIGWTLISQVRKGDISEAVFEGRFARGSAIPPIEIEAAGEKIYIEGVIDRLDILRDGQVKVIDYKTGKESFSVAEAKAGWKLQLMIYLTAGLGFKKKQREPAGVFYFVISNPMADMSKEDERSIKHKIDDEIFSSFRLEGAMINDEEVIKSIAGEFEGKSDIAPVKTLKDGTIAGSGVDRLFEKEEFETFMNEVGQRVKEACAGIVSGDIKVSPKKNKNKMSACTYCEYKNICSFDLSFADCKYEMIYG